MAENTQIVEKKENNSNFSIVLSDKLDSVSDALPKDFNKARFVQNALALVNENPNIAKYGQQKIMAGLLKGKNLQPRLLYPARLSFRFEGEIKTFTDKQKLREFSNTKLALQQILKELL